MSLVVPARAKLNLDLRVLGRRADGFHDLYTTFQAIELHDLVDIERAAGTAFEPAATAAFEVEGFEIDAKNNSLLSAHRAVEEKAGTTLPVKIRLHKRIPPGSGMGGASSDAAATLKGLAALFKLEMDLQQLAEQLGSDVPFFLHGGRARAEGRGEKLIALDSGPAWFALAWPGFELSTGSVYAAWDEVGGEGPNELERAAAKVEPRIERFAKDLGPGWQMTGSGSAFFKPMATREEAEAAVKGLECWTSVTAGVPRWA